MHRLSLPTGQYYYRVCRSLRVLEVRYYVWETANGIAAGRTRRDQSVKLIKIHSFSVCAFTCEIPLRYKNSSEELMVVNHNYIYISLFLHTSIFF